eukprot:6248079-Alexandrium_andersonii.AAC.1
MKWRTPARIPFCPAVLSFGFECCTRASRRRSCPCPTGPAHCAPQGPSNDAWQVLSSGRGRQCSRWKRPQLGWPLRVST